MLSRSSDSSGQRPSRVAADPADRGPAHVAGQPLISVVLGGDRSPESSDVVQVVQHQEAQSRARSARMADGLDDASSTSLAAAFRLPGAGSLRVRRGKL
jgi:hypothetical protein